MNSNIPQYIIAICPDDEVVEQIAQLKQQLYNDIGWFGSYRSLAHITLDAFNADNEVLQLRTELLKIFASEQQNHNLIFNSFSAFHESRTIFIAPDSASHLWLTTLAKSYAQLFNGSDIQSKFNPHLTIGRAIKPEYFQKALQVFSNQEIYILFQCNNIALRKFNHERKQYDIVERYYFSQPPESF